MPYIRVRPEQLKKSSEVIRRVQRELTTIDEKVYRTGNSLNWKVKKSAEVESCISKIKRELEEEASQLMRMENFLLQAARQYEELEQKYSIRLESGNKTSKNKRKTEEPKKTKNATFLDIYSKLTERMKAIFKAASKVSDIKELGFTASVIGYFGQVMKLFDKNEYGEVKIANLIKSSSEVWKSFYTVIKSGIKDAEIKKLLEMKFGVFADCIGVGGDFAGFIGTLIKALRTESYEDIEKMAESSVDLVKGVYLLGEISLKANVVAHFWVTVIKTGLSTGSAAAENLQKYLSDGKLTLGEVASIGVNSSVHGLDTLFSSLTYKVLSTENLLNMSANQLSEQMESWASEWGTRAGNYILDRSELKREYDNANNLNRTRLLLYAIIKSC